MARVEQVAAVGQVLLDPTQDLNRRFRALFTLRNIGGPEAISWISKAFKDESALLKHELAYCLGQMQDTRAIPTLTSVLKDTQEEPMVRHEAVLDPTTKPFTAVCQRLVDLRQEVWILGHKSH